METFQEEEYSKSAYQKHLEDEELGVSVYHAFILSLKTRLITPSNRTISHCF